MTAWLSSSHGARTVSAVRQSRILMDKRARIFVTGQNDRISPPLELQRILDEARQPVKFVEIPGGDHTLLGREQVVAEHVADFAAESLAK